MTLALEVTIAVAALCAVGCFALSVATKNYSQVDRLWSILPPLYVGWFAACADFRDPRLDVMATLATLWGARLTYNFARKGGYRRGSEDYRWAALRQRLSPIQFQLLNATFIAPFQNLILLLIALPAHTALVSKSRSLGILDAVAASGFVLFLVGEALADQQQWRFQSQKNSAHARGEIIPKEFLTTGLFAFSRHPNFFCEQALWWAFCLFATAASGRWFSVSTIGALLLTLVFQGSTWFTEKLTLGRYPAYAEYQRTTSRLIPWFSR